MLTESNVLNIKASGKRKRNKSLSSRKNNVKKPKVKETWEELTADSFKLLKNKCDIIQRPILFTFNRTLKSNVLDEESVRSTNGYTIGREKMNKLCLNDDEVSGYHASIKYDVTNQTYYITDLNSSNGILINNEEIESNIPTKIDVGYQITIGKTNFIWISPPPIPTENNLILDNINKENNENVVYDVTYPMRKMISNADDSPLVPQQAQIKYLTRRAKSEIADRVGLRNILSPDSLHQSTVRHNEVNNEVITSSRSRRSKSYLSSTSKPLPPLSATSNVTSMLLRVGDDFDITDESPLVMLSDYPTNNASSKVHSEISNNISSSLSSSSLNKYTSSNFSTKIMPRKLMDHPEIAEEDENNHDRDEKDKEDETLPELNEESFLHEKVDVATMDDSSIEVEESISSENLMENDLLKKIFDASVAVIGVIKEISTNTINVLSDFNVNMGRFYIIFFIMVLFAVCTALLSNNLFESPLSSSSSFDTSFTINDEKQEINIDELKAAKDYIDMILDDLNEMVVNLEARSVKEKSGFLNYLTELNKVKLIQSENFQDISMLTKLLELKNNELLLKDSNQIKNSMSMDHGKINSDGLSTTNADLNEENYFSSISYNELQAMLSAHVVNALNKVLNLES